ncbi:mammalian cell entry [Chlorella sorokiniana]|uniref:Mammalian cell entry n=1 Tax=Chlorella sorokiniana TaxID=3076 RepID=A0A2P6TFD4_CHLSO|nr:mammalian cell entry [Chlorella sorokiniana]|eukprot:PRW32684.1 mammalian cell entry [Chlorella sorokiniana]
MPQVDKEALSSEDEYMEMAANYGANACPLPPACPMPGELERLEVKDEYLESVDGMVGNYEFAIEDKKAELGEATDDLQRILAELEALEEAAGMNRSAAGGGAATASDYCEGAEVSELE